MKVDVTIFESKGLFLRRASKFLTQSIKSNASFPSKSCGFPLPLFLNHVLPRLEAGPPRPLRPLRGFGGGGGLATK